MQLIKKFKEHGEVVERLTIIGRAFGKVAEYCNKRCPYEGRVIYEALAFQYRPTIPGLFFHFLCIWLFRQKCDPAHDRN